MDDSGYRICDFFDNLTVFYSISAGAPGVTRYTYDVWYLRFAALIERPVPRDLDAGGEHGHVGQIELVDNANFVDPVRNRVVQSWLEKAKFYTQNYTFF